MKKIFCVLKSICIVGAVVSLVFISSCKKDKEESIEPQTFISDFIKGISTDNIRSNAVWLQGMNSRFALNSNRRDIAVGIQNRFISYGYADARLDSFNINGNYNGTVYNTMQYNVIATIPGTVSADSLCVVGAHYDCIIDEGDPLNLAPGADDNASGVSAMLEIARVMKANSYSPRTSIVFAAFAAEELDLCGSADLAAKYQAGGKRVKMMLNLDMIGFDKDASADDWQINIMDYDNSQPLRLQAASLAKTYTSLTPENDNQYNTEGDSYSFDQKGFPALFFLCFDDDPYYHTTDDLVVNCNFDYCCQVAKLNCSMLLYNNQ